jgi:hypothetical protein
LADADLARLVWADHAAFGEDKATRYKVALKTFVDQWADHELSALALSHWARVIQGEGDLVEARRLAQRLRPWAQIAQLLWRAQGGYDARRCWRI